MKEHKLFLYMIIIISSALLFLTIGFAQDDFHWDKELVSKVEIHDKALINKFVMEMFIPESNIEYMELFDVDDNGATEGDLLKVHPSRNVYSLDLLSKESRVMLKKIPEPPNRKQEGYTKEFSDPSTAEEKILFVLVMAIKDLYSQDNSLKLYFEQSDDGLYRFELLGFDPKVLKQDKDISFGKVTSKRIQDLLKALYKEFYDEHIGWQPTVIHVIKNTKEIIYVPSDDSKKKK